MSAFGRLRQGFAAATAATALFAAPACAQDDTAPSSTKSIAGSELASTVTDIHFLDDADDAASEWVANRSDRVAVSIRFGGATTYTPEFIQSEIERVLEGSGITNAVFFWEHGLENGSTSVALETDEMTFGPFGLNGELLSQHIPDTASQIRFNSRLTVAENTNTLN
ncbi:hypothetical protein AWH62_03205 [Maricaulis sp. W15]|nr:hypothetical protein AWH62_03205 [Maricaulis sp. W15]